MKKSQRHSIDESLEIRLGEYCFSIAQLYLTISTATNTSNILVPIEIGGAKTKNIVYPDVHSTNWFTLHIHSTVACHIDMPWKFKYIFFPKLD